MDPMPFQVTATVQVRDIAEARRFYREALGCLEGVGGEQWLHLSLFDHQIVCHINAQLGKHGRVASHYHLVDGKYVPASCDVVLEMKDWRALAKRLRQHSVKFFIEPCAGSHGALEGDSRLFFEDPSGNAFEVKSYCNSAKELLRCKRQRLVARWTPWAILAAFIVCCILLLPKGSENEIAAGSAALPGRIPSCASTGFCVP